MAKFWGKKYVLQHKMRGEGEVGGSGKLAGEPDCLPRGRMREGDMEGKEDGGKRGEKMVEGKDGG